MRRLAVKWPARRARRWRIGHAAPRSAWGTRRSLGTVRTPGKGDEMSLGPSPHSFHTQSRPRVSSLKKRPRTRSVHVPRIFEVRLSMIPRSWRSAGRATRSGNAARPHTTAPAWHCRRGGGRARHTSGKTERVKGCPARTGDTSCSAPKVGNRGLSSSAVSPPEDLVREAAKLRRTSALFVKNLDYPIGPRPRADGEGPDRFEFVGRESVREVRIDIARTGDRKQQPPIWAGANAPQQGLYGTHRGLPRRPLTRWRKTIDETNE